MPLNRPYKRIWRPMYANDRDYVLPKSSYGNYLTDRSVAPDRQQLVRAYHSIQRELATIFEYIDPNNNNVSTYSHRTYALLLRACTEFENNCKAILLANNYSRRRNLSVEDYHKLNGAGRFSEYQLYLDAWHPEVKVVRPFENWDNGHTLSWYSDYNSVKHHRSTNFAKASLDNTIAAVAAVFTLLVAQFNYYVAYENQTGAFGFSTSDEGDVPIHRHDNCLFSFQMPCWELEQKYEFNWDDLKDDPERFADFSF